MNFNSFEFLLFFPIVCTLYFLIKGQKARVVFLLLASYYFYMNWEPVYGLLLLGSTLSSYVAGLLIEKVKSPLNKRSVIIATIILNVSGLFIFKYYNFLSESIVSILNEINIGMSVPKFKLLLPIGISFYTFQVIGYLIDVYRKQIKVEKNFIQYAIFISFFPQLVAGPIERSTNLLPQFKQAFSFDYQRAVDGLKIMIWGFFMKIVVADRLALIVNPIYNNPQNNEGLSFIIATCFFAFQVYCDFAGYSNIAIGAAKIMGYTLMDNFKRPYLFSNSVTDFWRRNHISLTTWLMDYVYYPLVGSSSKLRWWNFCMVITFVISGLWHGANWTFVLWGLYHGIFIVISTNVQKKRKKIEKKYALKKNLFYKLTVGIYVFAIVTFSTIFFRANNVKEAFFIIKKIFTSIGDVNIVNIKDFTLCLFVLSILILKDFYEEYYPEKMALLNNKRLIVRWATYYFIILSILFLGVYGNQQFIYFQF